MVEVVNVEDLGENIGDHDIKIHNAILISKGMTNFEVLKELFPNIKFKKSEISKMVYGAEGNEKVAMPKMAFNMNWLHKKYKECEPPVLSDDELELIKALNKAIGKEYKYIARDTTRKIRFFETKPNRNELKNYYNLEDGYTYMGIQFGLLFPNIKFEDGLYDIANRCFIEV